MNSVKRFRDLVEACRARVRELFPWDLAEALRRPQPPLILDVREPYEFSAAHISGALNVPRGVVELACEYGYEETVPKLADARERDIVVVCRSGNRSLLAGWVLQDLGFRSVWSLATGLRGWNDYEQPLVDDLENCVDSDCAERLLSPGLRPDQVRPAP